MRATCGWVTVAALGFIAISCTQILDPEPEFVGGGGAAPAITTTAIGGGSPGTTASTSSASTSASTSQSSTSSGCGGVDGCGVALADASDDFEDGADGWCRLVPPQSSDPEASISCEDGAVLLRASSSTWNVMGYTPFLYRRVAASEGDFVVAAKLVVSNGTGGEPMVHAHGGGILIRRPNPTPGVDEAVVLLTRAHRDPAMGLSAVGYEQNAAGRMVEKFSEPGGGTVALAICKEGTRFRFFHHAGDGWHPRPMADDAAGGLLTSEPELEVGLAVHAYSTPELVQAEVDWVEIKSVSGSCEAALPDL